jgi:hypothetical protein
MSASRPIRLPAKDFAKKPLPFETIAGFKALRLHGATRPAVQFRSVPAQRFSHPASTRDLIYLGEDLETCLWESFGDAILNPGSVISRSIWMTRQVSEIYASAKLRLCDLTDHKTRTILKVDLSALKHTELQIPQTWGLAIMSHPEAVDGFYYASRFTGRRCAVLFGGNRIASILESKSVGALTDLEESGPFLEENEIALV